MRAIGYVDYRCRGAKLHTSPSELESTGCYDPGSHAE